MFEACPQDAVSVGWMFLLLCAWVVSEKILITKYPLSSKHCCVNLSFH